MLNKYIFEYIGCNSKLLYIQVTCISGTIKLQVLLDQYCNIAIIHKPPRGYAAASISIDAKSPLSVFCCASTHIYAYTHFRQPQSSFLQHGWLNIIYSVDKCYHYLQAWCPKTNKSFTVTVNAQRPPVARKQNAITCVLKPFNISTQLSQNLLGHLPSLQGPAGTICNVINSMQPLRHRIFGFGGRCGTAVCPSGHQRPVFSHQRSARK